MKNPIGPIAASYSRRQLYCSKSKLCIPPIRDGKYVHFISRYYRNSAFRWDIASLITRDIHGGKVSDRPIVLYAPSVTAWLRSDIFILTDLPG